MFVLNMIYDTNAGKNVQNLLSEHNLTTDICTYHSTLSNIMLLFVSQPFF